MKKATLLLLVSWLAFACQPKPGTETPKGEGQASEEPRGADNVAYKWGKMALEATANDTDRFKAEADHHIALPRVDLRGSVRCVV